MDPAERKKREPPDPEGHPPVKRFASDAHFEDVDPKEAPVLLYQNKAMQIRIKEMRMEVQSHEDTINLFKERQRLHDETLSCAHRVWDQLNDNAQKILCRLDFSYEGLASKGTPGTTLTHLLLQSPEPLHEITEYDTALQKRINNTQHILTRVAEAVEKQHANNERITAMFKDQAPAAIQERLQQLEAENKHLTTTLNRLQEEQQQKTSTHTHLENQNRSYSQQLDDLHAKFHLLETELTQTRRKVIKQEIPLPVGVIAQPRLPMSTTTTTTTTTTPNGSTGAEPSKVKKEEGGEQKQNGEGGHELADALAMAESRLEEAARLREEKVSLLRENTRLRDDLAHLSLDRVAASEPYKRMERETKVARESVEREKELSNRLRGELNQARDGRKREREMWEKEEAVKRRVMDTQYKDLQDTVTKLKIENHEIQGQVEQRMASLPSEKYIAELKLLVAARDGDITKLREECDRLNALNKHLNERKGDKMEDTLQAKLAEVSELQDKQRKLERELEDYIRKEKSWASRERDYRNMVDNFHASSKDRRDLHDLRVAERRLRDEVDDLRRERDEIRRTYDKSQRSETVRELEKKHAEELKSSKVDLEKTISKLNYQIKELKVQVESKTQDYDVMMSEVDSISKSYEDMQAQNKRLLLELGNKEDVTIQVASEGMKMKRQLEQTKIEARDMQERYARAEERCRNLLITIEELEAQVGQAQAKFGKVFDELQGTGMGMDNLRREARDAQLQAAEFKIQAESLEKSSLEARRKMEDLVVELEREREKGRRVEEDKASLKRKLDRVAPLRASSGGTVNIVEEELRGLKQKLTCSVCNDRLKSTVIAKCFHVFCHECVQTNLQIRKRRCPQCQAPFSANDVHNLYGLV